MFKDIIMNRCILGRNSFFTCKNSKFSFYWHEKIEVFPWKFTHSSLALTWSKLITKTVLAMVRRNGKNKNSRTRNKMSSKSTIRKDVTSTLLKFYFCPYCKLWTHPTPYRIWSARYQLISEWESVTPYNSLSRICRT